MPITIINPICELEISDCVVEARCNRTDCTLARLGEASGEYSTSRVPRKGEKHGWFASNRSYANEKLVIEVTGPFITSNDEQGRTETLVSIFKSCLELAHNKGCASIRIPELSSLIYSVDNGKLQPVRFDEVETFICHDTLEALSKEYGIDILLEYDIGISNLLLEFPTLSKTAEETAEAPSARCYFDDLDPDVEYAKLLDTVDWFHEGSFSGYYINDTLPTYDLSKLPDIDDAGDADLLNSGFSLMTSVSDPLHTEGEKNMCTAKKFNNEINSETAQNLSKFINRPFFSDPGASKAPIPGSLDYDLNQKKKTFSSIINYHIRRLNVENTEIYERVHMDRRLFSKVSNEDNHPSKETAIALAIAFRLDLKETKELLESAGYCLSPACKQDIIVAFYIKHEHYDILDINTSLFNRDIPLIAMTKKKYLQLMKDHNRLHHLIKST